MTKLKLPICLISLLIAVFLSACKPEVEEIPISNDPYLISYTKALTITKEKTQTLLTFVGSQYPAALNMVSEVHYNVDLYTVTYRTEFKGLPIVASGVVCIPDTNLSFPILSFQNGTNIEHSKAPSLDIQDDLSTFRFIEGFAGTGYILTISDYVGFGSSSDILHPYHHKESSNQVIIDLIKAAEELAAEESVRAESEKDLFLIGYSQGGWSTLSVLEEIENTNALDDFTVKATSCGAGAYKLKDVAETMIGIQTHPSPYYFPFIIYSQIDNGFLDQNLSDIFQQPYASNIPSYFNGLYTSEEVNQMLTYTVPDLFTSQFINDFNNPLFKNLRDMLELNSIHAWNVETNLRLYHSNGDNSVPIIATYYMMDDFESVMGSSIPNIEMIELNGLSHGDAVLPWGVETMEWILSFN